jgi:hypothetical protein
MSLYGLQFGHQTGLSNPQMKDTGTDGKDPHLPRGPQESEYVAGLHTPSTNDPQNSLAGASNSSVDGLRFPETELDTDTFSEGSSDSDDQTEGWLWIDNGTSSTATSEALGQPRGGAPRPANARTDMFGTPPPILLHKHASANLTANIDRQAVQEGRVAMSWPPWSKDFCVFETSTVKGPRDLPDLRAYWPRGTTLFSTK